jgi:uncharacterized protein (TIGR02145 family)
VAGGKMKEVGVSHWVSPNTGATNESGFSGLPGGDRNSNGTFYSIGNNGTWWSSTEHNTTNAWYRDLNTFTMAISSGTFSNKVRGLSVRCLRD